MSEKWVSEEEGLPALIHFFFFSFKLQHCIVVKSRLHMWSPLMLPWELEAYCLMRRDTVSYSSFSDTTWREFVAPGCSLVRVVSPLDLPFACGGGTTIFSVMFDWSEVVLSEYCLSSSYLIFPPLARESMFLLSHFFVHTSTFLSCCLLYCRSVL